MVLEAHLICFNDINDQLSITFNSFVFSSFFAALPPSRFGEPPLPALPLPLSSGDEELFSPGINDMSPNCCGDVSPTFEKPTYREMEKTMEASRFVAQHVKNKDKFESVSRPCFGIFFRWKGKRARRTFGLALRHCFN